jgi:hypothetical protein
MGPGLGTRPRDQVSGPGLGTRPRGQASGPGLGQVSSAVDTRLAKFFVFARDVPGSPEGGRTGPLLRAKWFNILQLREKSGASSIIERALGLP